jgi:hypothetical protein
MSCNITPGCGTSSPGCPDKFGCIQGQCPDFEIKRHDTKPPFKVSVEDCDGPLDLTDLVVEANMWAKGKLKANIADTDTFFGLADNIGFEQIMVGDIIIMSRPRLPEYMLVTAFDEDDKLVMVQRGYAGSTPTKWKKGTPLRIMKMMNAPALSEMVMQDIINIDGTTKKDQLTQSFLVYEWQAKDVCLPGCYYFEFKLMKLLDVVSPEDDPDDEGPYPPNVVPSFTSPSLTPEDFGCVKGIGVDWIRRFPVNGEGFVIHVVDSPTVELV